MADPILDKVNKLFESRAKAEIELKKFQKDVIDAVNNTERRVRVERLVMSCDEAMMKAFAKNEQLLELAKKTADPPSVTADLEKWLNDITVLNDEVLKTARDYLDQYPKTDTSSQTSVNTTTKKAKSSKSSSSKVSKSSSQRQRDLLIAKHKREEIEKQNEAAVRLAKQKQELELEVLQEENRKRLAEAHLAELELTEDLSETNEDFQETLSRLSGASAADETRRIKDWVDNSPNANEVVNLTEVVTTVATIAPSTTTSTVSQTVAPPGGGPQPTVLAQDAIYTPAPATTNVPTGVQTLALGSSSAAVPTTPMIVVQPPQSTMSVTQANTVNAPVIAQPPPQPTPTLTMPTSHLLPNLASWTFPTRTVQPLTQVTTVLRPSQQTTATSIPTAHTPICTTPTIPITSGGTVYYVQPTTTGTPAIPIATAPTAATLSPTAATFVPSTMPTLPYPSTSGFSIQDLALLLASTKKDHLPEWNLAQYSGDPMQWHEWFGQFKSAIDSAPLTDDVKLTYLKTLVTGKAKTAIAEFAYCGAMYKDALKTLERKFGQPQAVVSAYLDKLAAFPPVKMHNSESIIGYAAMICSLVGVFRSLNYLQDLCSASLLGQALQKLPPNMKEAWSMHTVKRTLDRPTLIDFNEWLKDKAEAHERMKSSSSKPKAETLENGNVIKTKTASKTFAATASSTQQTGFSKTKPDKPASKCVVCTEKHPLWKCPTFRKKTPTERAKLVAQNKLCFSCFQPDHSFRQCPQPRKCTKEGCGSTHNTFLHGAERVFKKQPEPRNQENTKTSGCIGNTNSSGKTVESSSLPAVSDIKGLLQVTEVELQSHDKSEKVFALCDSACSHSWISAKLAKRLNVHGRPTKLTVHGINANQVIETQMVELKLTPVHSGGSCSSFAVKPYVRDNLNVGTDVIDVDFLRTKYPHLEPIPLKQYSYADVEMILGQDVFNFIRPLEYLDADRKNTPVAVRLPLGWVLSGPLPMTSGFVSTCLKAVACNQDFDTDLANQVRSWYDMESYGAYKQVDSRSAADARATRILEETTYHDGCRYQVGMLWTDDESKLPNNYFSALVQLKSLERRLGKDPELKQHYSKTIQDDLAKGYIVPIDKSNCFKVDNNREWYLPHHPVVHPHKPGKVRRVLNGAAKFQGQSLNNALLTGPDLLQSLIHVLLRFRQHKFAVSADIEGMFLQVGVIPKDRPSLRFLWREDPASQIAVYQYVRHIFGSKDSPTCANYALKRTATDNQTDYPEAAESVHSNFYMDDYLESSPSIEEATKKAKDLVKLLERGGFKLTKFVSNVPQIPNELEPTGEPLSTAEKVIPKTEDSSHVLGLKWNHASDYLVVSRGTSPDTNRTLTQRVILSLVSAVYDPIGLVAPYTVAARLLLKDIWRIHGQQWDDNLPGDTVTKFIEWSKELETLSQIEIPRSYFAGPFTALELHMFGDSSQDIFSAVAFLRAKVTTPHGSRTELAFVLGKARVAPMKALTIPKLELQASLLASRLRKDIEKALTLRINQTFMWTDSTTVLQWIHSAEKQPVFIANRVAEILDLTTADEWNYVQSCDNPADAGTRGLPASALSDSPWLKGPALLFTRDFPFQPSKEFQLKLKGNHLDVKIAERDDSGTTAMTTVTMTASTFEWQKYSSFEKLLRIVAYMLRLLPQNEVFRTATGSIADPMELTNAQQKLFYLTQEESFPMEKKSLLNQAPISASSKLRQFTPFVGPKGLLRATGRTEQLAASNFDAKHPILLDSRHPVVRLYLEQLHETHCHQGADYLRALVQQQLAIVKLRTALRSIVSKCVTCRKRRARTLNPIMSDLPRERLALKSAHLVTPASTTLGRST